MLDLGKPITQAQFGALIGVTQPAVSDLVRRRILSAGDSAGEWLLAYCEHMREMAAGRGGDDGPALVAERARLAREQADKIAMQNAVTRNELAPAWLLEHVLVKFGTRTARILDTIPGTLRRRFPQLGSDDLTEVARIVAKARNLAATMRLEDVDADDEEGGGDLSGDAEEPVTGDAA
ncbi:MAG: terminase small subunit [Pseudoxanthomonas sp.]